MINSTIQTALSNLNVPVSFQNYKGTANTYITYFTLNESGSSWADDEEIATEYSVQIDIWSKTDYSTLQENVISAMKTSGFNRTSAIDLFEEETQFYHKAIRFVHTIQN